MTGPIGGAGDILGAIKGMFGPGGVLGQGSVAGQLFTWGLLETLISTAAAPGITQMQVDVNHAFPVVPLDADQNAQAAARGILNEDIAADESQKSGIDPDRWTVLRGLANQDPDLTNVMQAYWRGLIPWDRQGDGSPSVVGAMKQAGMPDAWAAVLGKMRTQLPSMSDALNAMLEGQVPEATAKGWYQAAGGDPELWQDMINLLGSAPTPVEAATMANRGVIPWTGEGADVVSFQQAFLEGPWRNKWLKPYVALAQYLPPPRTVTAMLSSGGLTTAEATSLLEKQGLTPDLATAYVNDAGKTKTKADKDLTQSAIISLYEAQIIGNPQAQELLSGLGYDGTTAGYLLTLADMRVAISAIKSAVSRVETAFIGHKIDTSQAQASLAQLGVPSGQIGNVITTWTLARQANVKVLTEAQVVDAWAANFLTQDEAMAELENQGYTPLDAWTLLSIKNKKELPGKPAAGPAAITAG